MLVGFASDCRLEIAHDLLAAGMSGSYQGHAGLRDFARDWRDAFERHDAMPREVVDAGNPVVFLGYQRMRARVSGIEFNRPHVSVVCSKRGLIVHERHFTDWDEALKAAGIATGP